MASFRIQSIANDPALKRTIPWWLAWAVFTALYLLWPIQTDFYTDEAYFSEMTLRFMQGQLPNYDFASNYLGLFYVYNSLWFFAFGASYFALRLGMLFLASSVFAPAVFFVSRRLLPLAWAVLATLSVLALTVSLNYSVSGNWYALFFSALAVLLFLRPPSRWKHLGVGLALGVVFLMKHTVAVYTGVALYLALVWQSLDSAEASGQVDGPNLSQWLVRLFCCIPPVLALFFIHHHLDVLRVLVYLLPLCCISVSLLKRSAVFKTEDNAEILKPLGIWLIGVSLPVLAFCIPYALKPQGVSRLLASVFIDYPRIYLNRAFLDYFSLIAPQSWGVSLWLATGLLLLGRKPKIGLSLLGLGFLLACLSCDIRQWSNITVSIYFQLPLWGILFGLFAFLKPARTEPANSSLASTRHPVRTIWLWGVLLFLGTYPLGMMFYAGYAVTPFVMLLVYWVYRQRGKTARCAGAALLLYACLFGVLFAYRQIGWYIPAGAPIFPNQTFTRYLDWDRAKIWVPDTGDLSTYSGRTQAYYALVKKYSTRADDWFMYSDGPEVYFLTHRQNPTRYSYAIDSTLSDGRDVIAGLENHQVRFVLVELGQNHFEQPFLADYLNQQFSFKTRVGQKILLFERKRGK